MSHILEIFGVDWRLLLVQAFNFGVLLIVLSYFLYRPLLSLIEKRQAAIAEGVRNAERAKGELEQIAKEKEAILTEASREADIIVERARERGLSKEAALLAEAEESGARLLKEAAEKAAEEKARALRAAQEEIAKMAVLGARKILSSERS